MAFSEVEMSILSQVAYKHNRPDGAEKQSLYDYLSKENTYNSLIEKLGSDYKAHLDGLLNKLKTNDYHIVKSVNDADGTGFAAFAIAGPDNDVTVVCRGTENFRDILEDASLTSSLETQQQEQMRKFVEGLEQDGYSSYSFTGHSLGGNLAAYGAIILEHPEQLNTCMTFNAPGFNAGFWRKNKDRIAKVQDRITSFQNERDFVSESMIPVGKVVVLECEGLDFLHVTGWDAHGMNALVPNADGTFIRNHTGLKDISVLGLLFFGGTVITDVASGILFPVTAAFNFVKWRKEQKGNDCRDFSAEAREMMINAAKETEDEKWWQVSRWDCWYKVDKFFGGLAADWDRYTGNVDDYYRKLIDMNDASSKEIKQIFEKVYGLDSTCASNLLKRKSDLHSSVCVKLKEICNQIVPKVTVHENYNIPSRAYLPVQPHKTNKEGERSPEAYNEVMEAFQVESNARYQPRNGDTWCNIYVWDVTTAMGCEIPHYYNRFTGAPMTQEECVKKPGSYYEMSASRMTKWLETYGEQYGWVACDEATAINSANEGMPTVAVGTNTGHVAMVAPQNEGETGVMISQAGGSNFNHGKIKNGFGNYQVKYYYHP